MGDLFAEVGESISGISETGYEQTCWNCYLA